MLNENSECKKHLAPFPFYTQNCQNLYMLDSASVIKYSSVHGKYSKDANMRQCKQ